MAVPLLHTILCFVAGIAVIIWLTTRYRVHAFFALLLACLITGLCLGLSVPDLITVIKEGFGNIMKSLGFIIVLGTTLGVLLEHTGSTRVMAAFILKKTGHSRAALAMSLTGFVVGLPVFCDSGYIVLNGLCRPLARRTGIPLPAIAISLATGLYSVHCLIPPHPGAAAAAATLGTDLGKLILLGIVVAIPAMGVGHWWAVHAGKKYASLPASEEITPEETAGPSVLTAFLPVILPVLLIALKSFFVAAPLVGPTWTRAILWLGDPVVALSIAVLLAFRGKKRWKKQETSGLLQEAAEKAGGILVIIGAGGAFGAVFATATTGEQFSQAINLSAMGLFFPFLLCSFLKTAQGSSTIAIITAASIVQPLIIPLGLDSATGRLLCTLSLGAGSMMISHANDAYFWVISKFTGLEMKIMLRVYSIATLLMGVTAFAVLFTLSFFLL